MKMTMLTTGRLTKRPIILNTSRGFFVSGIVFSYSFNLRSMQVL